MGIDWGKDSEKRAAPRVGREVIVHYSIKAFPQIDGLQITARPPGDQTRTRDLSESGICFTTSTAIPQDTILEIKLRLPSLPGETISIDGQVISFEEIKENIIYKQRLKFINLDEEQKQELRKFVQLFSTS